MKEIWDSRYASDEYVYGKSPNEFLKETVKKYNINGKFLFPAEGEGRNAVYAAKLGFSVFAFDISTQAKNKALKLAEEAQVNITYEVGDLNELDLKEETYDVAVLIAAHFPPQLRAMYHHKIGELIKPNGLIILEGFSVNNFEIREKNPEVGGPNKKEMLFTEEGIRQDFKEFEVILLEETEAELKEGKLHNGKAKLIRFIGKKR